MRRAPARREGSQAEHQSWVNEWKAHSCQGNQKEPTHRCSRRSNWLTGFAVEEETLQDWRMKGEGPPYIKLGFAKNSPIRYPIADVEAWEASLLRITPIAQSVDSAFYRHLTRR